MSPFAASQFPPSGSEEDAPSPRASGIFCRLSGDQDLIGSVVSGLRVERIIGEGGIGVVYCASSPAGDARVALKVLQERHAGDLGLINRFDREIAYACRVDHPNVAKILGHGHLPDGRPYLVMELLSGCTLGELVRREGPLSIERALSIGDQILAGLAAMHEARIVHRDLQPDNVFIAPFAGAAAGDHVTLLDLGFAQEPGVDTGDGVSADSPGALVGTLAFMAPEQAIRSRAITEQSDLFTTALLIYYALSGKLPFRGEDDRLMRVALVRSAPIPLRKERRDVPALLDAILARSLAKHPDARFRGAVEMRAALGELSLARERWGRRRSA